MKKPGLKNRLLTASTGLTVLLSMVFGVTLATTGGSVAFASTTHKMSVKPIYEYAGKSNASTFSCQSTTAPLICYSPNAILNAYDITRVHNAGITGKNTTIVIIDAFGDPTLLQDLQVEDTTFGLPAAKVNVIAPFGLPTFDLTNADEVNWSGEIALDVESAHAVAPAATIDLVVSLSDQDSDLQNVLQYAVDHRLGDVISQSYGEAESCTDPSILAAEHKSFQQAIREGITVFASSGDDGAAQLTCDGNAYIKSVSSPASDPLVTSVGATFLNATEPAGNYVSESAWNDPYGSTGGGYSTIYKRPFYQIGYVHNTGRGVPDVAYSGAVNGGLLIAWSQGDPTQVGSIYIFGGTSAGSPQWAAMTDLVDSVFGPQGDINPLLYLFEDHLPSVFHDVTTGNNSVEVEDTDGTIQDITGYNATRGWDATTGLGSIDLGNAILGSGHSCWQPKPTTD